MGSLQMHVMWHVRAYGFGSMLDGCVACLGSWKILNFAFGTSHGQCFGCFWMCNGVGGLKALQLQYVQRMLGSNVERTCTVGVMMHGCVVAASQVG